MCLIILFLTLTYLQSYKVIRVEKNDNWQHFIVKF